ncbi:ABC transporter F family member 4-like isoform X1 [Dreissena polymorpha]|uniref:ABC transporter F family member 4-like isoform X1 n=1 Tax=Dreissena polymorpha TaxID=45954 RepID=UPI002263CA84|nr:ABC transporter F family member 4-like isoform X1 [Dreissena polymorpha]
MASPKPEIAHDGPTQEGDVVAEKPAVKKEGTMAATAKEGQSLLEGTSIDPDATTRGQQKKLDEIAEEAAASPAKKPRISKSTTMVNTAKEAKTILGKDAPDADALTRGQQKKLEDIQAEKPSPKKPKLSKHTTMAATAKEGAALLEGEKLGDTRQETKKAAKPAGPKRNATIQKTLEEAKHFVDVDVNEGRRTRSAGKPKPEPPKPAMKKAGTMQKTAKEGKEFLKRGKKSKKAEEEEKVEEEDEEEEKKEEAEEDAE